MTTFKRALLAVLAIAAMAGTAAAADKPDFSGEWKMNPAKSNYGMIPKPASVIRKITHAEPSLTIAEEQAGGAMALAPIRTYTTDGRQVVFHVNGAEVESSAGWDGAAIAVNTEVGVAGLLFKERMSLSDDGKELTSKVRIVSDQGEGEMTLVFDRQ